LYARVLEENGTVIEDEVDTRQLLPRLDEDTGEGTEEDLVVTRSEAVKVRRLAQLLLLLEGKPDLVEFGLEVGMVGWEGNETRESTGSIVVAFLLDEPSRRFREKDHANSQDKTPNELDGDGDPPRSVSIFVLGGIVDNGGDEETNGDRPLIPGNDGTSVWEDARQ
jgi:hypothetical protein